MYNEQWHALVFLDFMWTKRGPGRFFLEFLTFSPTTKFNPSFLVTQLIHFVSFRFISPCDGATGVVGRHTSYLLTFSIGVSSHLIPRPGPVSDTTWYFFYEVTEAYYIFLLCITCLISNIYYAPSCTMHGWLARWIKWRACDAGEAKKCWRMNCDVGEVTERLENELCCIYLWALFILQPFRNFTYVTTHSPTLPSLYLRHSSFSSPSVASPTSQLILQPFFRFSSVTSSSLNSPGLPPMCTEWRKVIQYLDLSSVNWSRLTAIWIILKLRKAASTLHILI